VSAPTSVPGSDPEVKGGAWLRARNQYDKSRFALIFFLEVRRGPDSTFAFANNETETLFPRKGSSAIVES
jgi:hypothetical protein